MMDTVDRFFDHRAEITFVEPFPGNLKELLKPQDYSRIRLIEDRVQTVPVGHVQKIDCRLAIFCFIHS